MRRILIIDDHTDIRENIAEILTLAGFETYTAENGKKGVELALQHQPDLVICDIMMPELDGYGVLHLLKRNTNTDHISFIFLTAKTERTDFRKGMEMGADDYLTKPFDDVELLNAIEIRFKKQELIAAKYASGEKGANEMLKALQDWESYDSENFSKKKQLYAEGKRPRYLYYLKTGKIKSYQTNEDGKEYITNLYGPGDFIGYHALLEDRPYNDTAEVLEEAEVAMIPKDEFLNAVYNDMNIASRFIKLISKNIKENEERLLSLAYGSLRKRVAKGLLDIHQKFNSVDISRDDLAHFIGTATESLIRTLSDFKAEKLIEIKEGRVRILQPDKLANL